MPNLSVTLRRLRPADEGFLYAMENHPDVAAQTGYVERVTRKMVRDYLKRFAASPALEESIRLVVCVAGASGAEDDVERVGIVDLSGINRRDKYAEVGIAVLPEYRNRGIAAAALRMLERLACKMQLRNLLARVAASNVAAITLFEGRGYSCVGALPQYHEGAEGREDVSIYSKRINRT